MATKNKKLKFKLANLDIDGTKAISLCVTDEDGVENECGSICAITNAGKLILFSGLADDLGLQIDKDGVIKYEIIDND